MKNQLKCLDPLIEWYKRQGYNVIQSQSSGWVEFCRGVYQAFPYTWIISPSKDELSDLLQKNKILALRYSCPITAPVGQISYHVVYDKQTYPLSSLCKKARHDVAHGLEYATYEPISLCRLADEGWWLRKDTLIRQGRSRAETQAFWVDLCSSAEGLPNFEAWGALHAGKLVASLLAFTLDDTVSILYQQSLSEYMKFGVNNTLAYTFTEEVLHRAEIRRIFYGLQSLDAPSSVDEFKFRMNYTSMPVRQRVVFNPVVAPLIQPWVHHLLCIMKKYFNDNLLIAKGEGMVRFYLKGKYRLPEQEWPTALLEHKTEIIAHAM